MLSARSSPYDPLAPHEIAQIATPMERIEDMGAALIEEYAGLQPVDAVQNTRLGYLLGWF